MDKLTMVVLMGSIVCMLSSVSLVVWSRLSIRRTIRRLTQMVDCAIEGNFKESKYDESAVSALETKLSRYIGQIQTRERNLDTEKNRIKSLVSDISHQTKTPLSNILLYSQLLQEQPHLSNDCADMVDQIVLQSDKLQFLIHALVKTSRLEAGIISVSPRKESIADLLVSVCEEVKQQVEAKEIQIKLSCDCLEAVFDRKWTAEAIHNIVDNAIKYTPHGGSITVSAVSYELFCRIDITDTGIGIAEYERNEIFQRFYRSSAVDAYEGVGIGLYLAREMIAAQGGYIKVNSTLHQGSIFSVFLPITK
ncbi:HAMP domain-containing histidine kinase [Paenibacillus sp. N3/727]|uniref:sensor histidine kinase n=1 Tax=Paenibacillus sp. N3/727 TaxID=2925845 RepID=UPI001F5312F5|nr:HAMP domain-containing sensor histidine kinase [Paenibacillus sp. N3/727]UNK20706.1 HAMP domain-containing histidine kinase [Paenibacillus sp. N3/727]